MKDTYSKKTKIVLWIIFSLFLASVAVNYYDFMIKGDYIVTRQVPCDPSVDSCFVSDCESNDPTCDTETKYKKISAPSKYAGTDYEKMSCSQDNSICNIITCQEDTVEPGEKCFK